MGNLTREPELKSLPSGIKVCNFSLATNFVRKNAQGQKIESADYHNIVVYGVQAENCFKYLHKGSTALIEGRISTRSWDGPDGKKNYRTEIVSDRVTFVGSSKSAGANTNAEHSNEASGFMPDAEQSQSNAPDASFDIIDFGEDPNPEDIPF